MPKPNDTRCANYTGWNIKIIMHFRQLQHPYLKLNHFDEKQRKTSLLKEHYWGLPNQDKSSLLSYFGGQKYRVIEKMVEFNGLKCVFDQILNIFFFLHDQSYLT